MRPDARHFLAGETELSRGERRGERVGELHEGAIRAEAGKARLEQRALGGAREPFDRQARDDRGQHRDALVGQQRLGVAGIAADHAYAGTAATEVIGERRFALDDDETVGRTTGGEQTARHAAGAAAQFEHDARTCQLDFARHRLRDAPAARDGRADAERVAQPVAEKRLAIAGRRRPAWPQRRAVRRGLATVSHPRRRRRRWR